VLPGVVLGDDTGQQVALGRDDFTVLVGVFVEQRGKQLARAYIEYRHDRDSQREKRGRLNQEIRGLVEGHHHIVRQQVLPGVVLGDDTGQQVALGRDDFTVSSPCLTAC
jgi:hypothetical protein